MLSVACKKLMDNVSLSEPPNIAPPQNEGSPPDANSA